MGAVRRNAKEGADFEPRNPHRYKEPVKYLPRKCFQSKDKMAGTKEIFGTFCRH